MLKTELYENAFGWLAYDKTTYYTELYLLSYMQLKKKLSRVGGGGGVGGWVVGLTGNRANSAPLELGLGLSLAIISPTSRPLIKELLLS